MMLGGLLFGDFTLVYEMGGEGDGKREEVIQYHDAKHVKLSFREVSRRNLPTPEGEYIIDGVRYAVVREDGKLSYMNMSRIDQVTERLTEELNVSRLPGKSAPSKPFFTRVKKSGKRTVAGIQGEVWEVESEEDGKKYREKIVVSDNRDLIDAMQRTIGVLQSFGEGPYGMEIDDDLVSMMLVADGYVLLSAEGMVFRSLDHREIEKSVFRLPKEAVNGMKNLPKMDKEKEDAGKKILKSMLE